METLDEPRITRHRLDVDQYDRMAEAGIFEPDARIELIEGEVIDMATIGTRHYAAVSRLNRLIVQATGERAVVSIQQSLRLDRFSEPEPDVTVAKPRDDFYASALPTGADTFLVIEVADSSLAFDLRTKARLYATHGVAVYWVVDLASDRLHIHSAPRDGAYTDVAALVKPASVALPGFSDIAIDLSGLFA